MNLRPVHLVILFVLVFTIFIGAFSDRILFNIFELLEARRPSKIFSNEKYGFEFQYHSGWELHTSPDDRIRYHAVSSRSGYDAFELEINENPQYPTLNLLEDALKAMPQNRVSYFIIAGQNALKVQEDLDLGSTLHYYFYHNNALFHLSHHCASGDCNSNRLQKQVIESFRFF